MKEIKINVKGMHCTSCVKLIESGLMKLKGISSVQVSLPSETATVKFDPKVIGLDEIEHEIRDLGYGAGGKPGSSNSSLSKISDTGSSGKGRTILQGISYGLVPHIGCIGFILATVLGATVATEFFKPLLMNPYFFYILIGVSFGFATISSVIYLKKQGFITVDTSGGSYDIDVASNTLQRKWKYLTTMFGTTIGINLLMFLFIFPMLANFTYASPSTALTAGASTVRLQVDIPCTGHAPLISGELKKLSGVESVKFSGSNTFDVAYDPGLTTKADILSLEIFKTYKATEAGLTGGSVGSASAQNVPSAADASGAQVVRLYVQGSSYMPNPIRVKKGVPVRLVGDIANMPGCSKDVVISDFNVRKYLTAGDNVMEFTPDKSGTFAFSCSMNMYRGQIVVENADGTVDSYSGSATAAPSGTCGVASSTGGCGCGAK
jgi:copper chaperone CopZ